MDEELEKIICKAIPLPTCPQKKEAAILTRLWLKREIIALYTPKVNYIGPNVGPMVIK